jgi:hypothetical protein
MQGVRGSCLHSSATPSRVRCARCVPAASTGGTGPQRICRSAGQRVSERRLPLKAVAPVRIRSGLPSSTSTTRPLTSRNEGQGPYCVSGRVRPGPAVGGHLCPIRARVRGGIVVTDSRLDALADERVAAVKARRRTEALRWPGPLGNTWPASLYEADSKIDGELAGCSTTGAGSQPVRCCGVGRAQAGMGYAAGVVGRGVRVTVLPVSCWSWRIRLRSWRCRLLWDW